MNVKDIIEIKNFSDKLVTDKCLDKREVHQIISILNSVPTDQDPVSTSEDEESDAAHASENSAPPDRGPDEHTEAFAESFEERSNESCPDEVQSEPEAKRSKRGLRKHRVPFKPYNIIRRSKELVELERLRAQDKWYKSGKTRRYSSLRH